MHRYLLLLQSVRIKLRYLGEHCPATFLEANIFWFPGRNHWYDETRMLYYDGYCWTVTHWEGSGQLLDSEFSISATSGFYTKGEAALEARASYYTPCAWYYSKTEV